MADQDLGGYVAKLGRRVAAIQAPGVQAIKLAVSRRPCQQCIRRSRQRLVAPVNLFAVGGDHGARFSNCNSFCLHRLFISLVKTQRRILGKRFEQALHSDQCTGYRVYELVNEALREEVNSDRRTGFKPMQHRGMKTGSQTPITRFRLYRVFKEGLVFNREPYSRGRFVPRDGSSRSFSSPLQK